MKLLIASDIHGSATWCAKLMERIDAEAPDRVVLLGDLLYHGPRNDLPEGYAPKKVIPLLDSVADKVIAVRGNCEAEVDQMVLGFPCMADDAQLTLDDGTRLMFAHGHLFDPFDAAALPHLPQSSWLFTGHTHIKRDEVLAGIRCINPGSVSIPKDGSHSFAVYEDGQIRFETLS